jgi:hypothetical protein
MGKSKGQKSKGQMGWFLLLSAAFFMAPVQKGFSVLPTPQSRNTKIEPLRPGYAGDAACATCHQEQSIGYMHTLHRSTSSLPTKDTILGSFQPGSNILMISDPAHAVAEPGLYFKMEEKDGNYYESAVTGWGTDLSTRTEKIAVITGSGVRGVTYLYWDADRLYELPVSYWTDHHQWINSPGYTNDTADFSRPVNPGCLECHATYIKALSDDPMTNQYDKSTLVTGITCERCHGPALEHIARQRGATASTQGQAIINPAHFSRDRQVDLCALCHNGTARQMLAPAFSYIPGQPLDKYFRPLPSATVDSPDVHGNQVGLLERSRCYLSSPQMSCSTCHDVHAPEKTAASYSGRCLTCHQWQSCPVSKKMGHAITKNCIDCHMPVQPTNVIVSQTGTKEVRAHMRNHWIKVYPQISEAFLKQSHLTR